MLEWSLKWGSEEKTLLEIQRSTGVTPRALQERPRLEPGASPSWDAFWLLSGGRGSGMQGPLPVALSEILSYLHLIGEDRSSERLKLLRIIRNMDAAFLSHIAKKNGVAKK